MGSPTPSVNRQTNSISNSNSILQPLNLSGEASSTISILEWRGQNRVKGIHQRGGGGGNIVAIEYRTPAEPEGSMPCKWMRFVYFWDRNTSWTTCGIASSSSTSTRKPRKSDWMWPSTTSSKTAWPGSKPIWNDCGILWGSTRLWPPAPAASQDHRYPPRPVCGTRPNSGCPPFYDPPKNPNNESAGRRNALCYLIVIS